MSNQLRKTSTSDLQRHGQLSIDDRLYEKSDMTDKIKRIFSPSSGCVETAIWDALHGLKNKRYEEKAWRQLHKNATSCIEQVLETTLQSSSCTATYHPSWKLSKLEESAMQETAGEVMTNMSMISHFQREPLWTSLATLSSIAPYILYRYRAVVYRF